ncbi:MAG: hypothetical protein A2046_15290 [Bacteroidetes bacterium GWA2_30_7]|nr:MAG: hypothetical protein A2046_15290 [Bacteroidetes bacterium GWA2_30_7]
MNIFQRLEAFVTNTFKTTLDIFLEALKMSPNAQGYVSGSISELLLKKNLQELGFEVKRIREKWEGKKHSQHHGDFYFRKNDQSPWFVLESKGVKSNTEHWNKLYNYPKLKKVLFDYQELIHWIDTAKEVEPQIEKWIAENLPEMVNSPTLYSFEEIQDYLKTPPKKETDKLVSMKELANYTRDEIDKMIKDKLMYLMSKVRVLDTHFVSGAGGGERTQATPRKDEFNLISVDIFLRFNEHKFLFANPKHLDSSGKDANHLQQNYIMGFVFPQTDGSFKLDLTDEWSEDFNEVCETLIAADAVNENDMQIDNRNVVVEN